MLFMHDDRALLPPTPLLQDTPFSGFWAVYQRSSAVLLNSLAAIAGSSVTFGMALALILAWAIGGIFVHDNDIWQISMQVIS